MRSALASEFVKNPSQLKKLADDNKTQAKERYDWQIKGHYIRMYERIKNSGRFKRYTNTILGYR